MKELIELLQRIEQRLNNIEALLAYQVEDDEPTDEDILGPDNDYGSLG